MQLDVPGKRRRPRPDDVSVVGLDDIEGPLCCPALTTIRQPFAEIAARAVSLLLQLIGDEDPETTQIVLPPELIVRQSTREV
jgi:LacI family transcriptional regulator